MKVDLPGQMEIPIRATTSPKPIITGTKEELGVNLAKLLTKYDARPSSELWIEIQATARKILE